MDSILFVIFILLFDNRFDLRIYNSAQSLQALLRSRNAGMLVKPEALQVFQVSTDLRCYKPTSCHQEILADHRLAFLQIPVRIL